MEQDKGNFHVMEYVPWYGSFQLVLILVLGYVLWAYYISIFPFSANGGKSHNLEALTHFDISKLLDACIIGADILHQMQELQIRHWGHEDIGCIPEDTMQQLILGANRILDVAISLEKEALTLKQQGLHLWNMAIGGQACGRMLQILEDIFGFPEPADSVAFGQTLQPKVDIPEDLPPEAEEEDPGPSKQTFPSQPTSATIQVQPNQQVLQ